MPNTIENESKNRMENEQNGHKGENVKRENEI